MISGKVTTRTLFYFLRLAEEALSRTVRAEAG